ncbi:MAG: endolytic transglycosylase MltG [Bacilli bacterium]
MIKRKFNIRKFIVFLIVIFVIILLIFLGIYGFSLGKTDKSNKNYNFDVTKNSTYLSLASELKKNDLIKSKLSYKIYVKLHSLKPLEEGTYTLRKSMGVSNILKQFEKGNKGNEIGIWITIPEGKHITDFADILSKKTNNTKEDILKVWQSKEFLDKVTKKYWFVKSDIYNKDLKNPLEGYFFPSTYQLSGKKTTPEEAAYMFLDQMGIVLNKYKKELDSSKYNVHNILTLSSIIEHEAILDEDRFMISGVFYNRLKNNMKLESCATVGYAIGQWKTIYTYKDLAVQSPYNTYVIYGLPVGPGSSPGEKSIEAALRPKENEYFFFMADICKDNKTYYSKNLKEHELNVKKYLTCF